MSYLYILILVYIFMSNNCKLVPRIRIHNLLYVIIQLSIHNNTQSLGTFQCWPSQGKHQRLISKDNCQFMTWMFCLSQTLFRSFPYSLFFSGFVTRVARMVPIVEQELLLLLGRMRSLPMFSGVRVVSDLCVVCISLIVFFVLFSFGHSFVCPSLIWGF